MSMDFDQVRVGAIVYGNDGDKIGEVAEVAPNYVMVEKGFLFKKDIYIPRSAVSSVDAEGVYLNESKDSVNNMDWDQPPSDQGSDYTTTPTETTTGAEYREGVDTGTLSQVGGVAPEVHHFDQGTRPTEIGPAEEPGHAHGHHDHDFDERAHTHEDSYTGDVSSSRTTEAEGTTRIPRHEEELVAEKGEREAGRVRISRDVEEHEQSLDVPVRSEEVHVQSRTVDRPADDSEAFQSEEIEVPVHREDVTTHKEARVAEELDVEKRAREDTETVSDTVRKERINVDEEGDVRADQD